MSRIEFPSTPIGASHQNGHQEAVSPFSQLSLEGLDTEQSEQIEFGNCMIASPVTFKKLKAGNQWGCHIVVSPDLMHPDQQGEYEAFAHKEHADKANTCHLRPGDRATMSGHTRQEVIELGSGETRITNYFYVTDVQVLSRSPRKSLTAYEQARHR